MIDFLLQHWVLVGIITIILIILAILFWPEFDDGISDLDYSRKYRSDVIQQIAELQYMNIVTNFSPITTAVKKQMAFKFKVGDLVRVTNESNPFGYTNGDLIQLTGTYHGCGAPNGGYDGVNVTTGKQATHIHPEEVELEDAGNKTSQTINKPMYSLLNKARALLRGEPDKSLIAKGITNDQDELTGEGQILFMDFLYRTNKVAFVADPAVAALLAEKEKPQ